MGKIKWESKEEKERTERETLEKIKEEEILKDALSKAPEQIVTLETENMSLMLAAAETYEQMYNENMSLRLAVAEMYEELQILKGGTP